VVDRQVIVGLNAVIVAVVRTEPRILTVRPEEEGLACEGAPALPFGPFDAVGDRTLELGLRRWVRERTDLELGYAEQLYTFGDRFRDPREREGGPRLLSIGYLALAAALPASALTTDWYRLLPWEEHRNGMPPLIANEILPALSAWAGEGTDPMTRRQRRDRITATFPSETTAWNDESVLERYELLYEAGLVREASAAEMRPGNRFGEHMALDHRRILATAIARIRGKLKYRPLVFDLLPPTFSLLDLQTTVEALAGRRTHKQNFRRFIETTGLVERTGSQIRSTGGRPADAFRFRRETLREHPTPGVKIPRSTQSTNKS
jgi:hypothetical protein